MRNLFALIITLLLFVVPVTAQNADCDCTPSSFVCEGENWTAATTTLYMYKIQLGFFSYDIDPPSGYTTTPYPIFTDNAVSDTLYRVVSLRGFPLDVAEREQIRMGVDYCTQLLIVKVGY